MSIKTVPKTAIKYCMIWMLFALSFPAFSLNAGEVAKLEFRKVPSSTSSTAILKHGDILYAAGWKGLKVYRLTNPEKPELIASDARIIGRQMALSGNTLYITARENGLWILDISKPERPQVLTRFDTVEMATGIAVSGNIVFITERIYGVEILDCSNPGKPRHIGFARGGEVQSATIHNNILFGGSWGGGTSQTPLLRKKPDASGSTDSATELPFKATISMPQPECTPRADRLQSGQMPDTDLKSSTSPI